MIGTLSFGKFKVAAAAVVLTFAVACGGTTTTTNTTTTLSDYKPAAGVNGGQLVYSDWEPVEDLNILSSSAATTQEAAGVIWASLWQFDPKNAAFPDLVTDVPTVSNGLVKLIDDKHFDITIKLRKGLKWNDGSPLTSADVKFTIDAICDPDTGAVSQSGFDHIASMEAKDTETLILHMGPNKKGTCGLAADTDTGIYASYISDMDIPVLPSARLASVKHADFATNAYFTKKPDVTSGPYMVQDFTPGPAAQVVMVPNPHYFDGRSGAQFFGHKPYLDKLIYKIYGDKSSQIAGLKAGDSDLGLDLIAKDLPALTANSAYQTVNATGLLDEFITVNLGNNTAGCDAKAFAADCGSPSIFKDDKPLRQAADLAIDKDQMNTQLVGGIGKPMNGPFVSALAPFYDTTIPTFKRDVTKANSLLDGDGWTKGSDGTRSKGGKKLAWTIATTANNPQRAAEQELLISNWKEIGATVTAKNYPAGKFFNDFKGGGILATGQYDMGMYANNWSPDPSGWCLTVQTDQIPTAANPSGSNWGRSSDPKMDDLCKQGAATVDLNKRVGIYKQLQTEWRDFTPTISLYERPDVFSHSANFGNFAPSVNTCLAICNATDWFNKAGKK